MPYPLEDAGFTLWYGDIETQLKLQHGATARDLGLDRHMLQQRYYAGESVFTALASIEAALP
ncbi:MAG: hypothetical protein F8N37_21265 [Telmatospirillum sp.]|nr:hypothetical protein [Telmatospirillum sp.]